MEFPADGLERCEAHGLVLACLQDGEVGLRKTYPLGQLVELHLALGHLHV